MERGDYVGRFHAWKIYNEEYDVYDVVYTLSGNPSAGDAYVRGNIISNEEYGFPYSAWTSNHTIDSVRTEKPVVNYNKKLFVTVRTELIENGEYVLTDVTEYYGNNLSFGEAMAPTFEISGMSRLSVSFFLGETADEEEDTNKFMYGENCNALSSNDMTIRQQGIYDKANDTFMESVRGKTILIRANRARC